MKESNLKQELAHNASGKSVLTVEKLVAGYGELKILKDISMELKKSQIVSIIGPNGSGKSTLIKSIYSLTDIFSGQIFCQNFEGKIDSLLGLKPWELLEKKFGYVNQGKTTFATLTVKENLNLAGAMVYSNSAEIESEKQKIFNFFPMLADKKNEMAFSLSGGQQQQLALARVMIQKPYVILLDEPTLGLNPQLQKDLFEKIEKLRDESGVTFLMVEQNAKRAIEISDYTYLLENGKVALSGGKDILKNPVIKKVYLGG